MQEGLQQLGGGRKTVALLILWPQHLWIQCPADRGNALVMNIHRVKNCCPQNIVGYLCLLLDISNLVSYSGVELTLNPALGAEAEGSPWVRGQCRLQQSIQSDIVQKQQPDRFLKESRWFKVFGRIYCGFEYGELEHPLFGGAKSQQISSTFPISSANMKNVERKRHKLISPKSLSAQTLSPHHR